MVPLKRLCRPPPASGAPRAALCAVAETMAGFRGAAPQGWQPRVGRTCVCYGARVPTPAGKLSFLVFEPTRRDLKGTQPLQGVPPFLTDSAVEKAGFRVAERTWVCCGSPDRGAGEKPGRSLSRDKNTGTPGPKVAGPQRRWLRRRWTPIPCALGAPGGLRSPSLLKPYASLLPGVPPAPGCAVPRGTPTHSACWRRGSRGCSACTHPSRPAAGSLC